MRKLTIVFSLSLCMFSACDIPIKFREDKKVDLTIFSNIEGAGIVAGAGDYLSRTYVDISASPEEGYKFIGWYYDNTLLSDSCEYRYLLPDENVTLEARFEFIIISVVGKTFVGIELEGPEDNITVAAYREYISELIVSFYGNNIVNFTYPVLNGIDYTKEFNILFEGNYTQDGQIIECTWIRAKQSNSDDWVTLSQTTTLALDDDKLIFETIGNFYDGTYAEVIYILEEVKM